MPAGGVDKYSNILSEQLTLSAANTLSFSAIDVGLNLFDKIALLVHKIQILVTSGFVTEMVAVTDSATWGIVQSNSITTLSLSERACIDVIDYHLNVRGTAGDAELVAQPFERDYSTLPGGGILIAPKPLYFAATSGGWTAALNSTLRMYFTIHKLKDADYLELLESRRFFG